MQQADLCVEVRKKTGNPKRRRNMAEEKNSLQMRNAVRLC